MNGRFTLTRSLFAGFGLALLLATAPGSAQEAADAPVVGEEGDVQKQIQKKAEEAIQQFDDGEFEKAAQSFTVLVNAFEQGGAYDPRWVLFRAKSYAQLEEYEAAIEDLKTALQYAQGSPQFQQLTPEIQNTRAEVYMKVDAYQAALPDLQAAVQANRSNPQYQFNLGKAMVKLGGAEPGEKALTKYLDAEVEDEEDQRAEALRLRGQAFGGLRKFEQARADLAAAIELEPNNYEAYFTRSQIALIEKSYAASAEDLKQAIAKYEPKDEEDKLPFAQGYLTLASVYEEMGKEAGRENNTDEAQKNYALCKQTCDDLIDLLPENDQRAASVKVAALFRKGVSERLLGELGQAVTSFSKVLELDPNQGEAYFRRGICFHFMGEERMAIRDFEQAASIDFDSPRSNLWKGMSWAKLGELNEAIRAYGESIAVSDRYTPAYINRGLAHLSQGEYRKAINDLNEAIRLKPTDAMSYYRRGKAQVMAGEREKAIQSFMNAIELDAKLRPAYDAVATELTANGQSALASEYRRQAAQIGL